MFSLIVATIGRTMELDRLLESLRRQSQHELELIIVDQNTDGRLDPVVRRFSDLSIKHLRCEPGVSHARNLGIRASTGDVIATPDDDCWYPDDLLASVKNWLEAHRDYDVLFTDARNQNNKPMRPKWPPPAGPCTKSNVWDCTGGITGFYRRKVVDTI